MALEEWMTERADRACTSLKNKKPQAPRKQEPQRISSQNSSLKNAPKTPIYALFLYLARVRERERQHHQFPSPLSHHHINPVPAPPQILAHQFRDTWWHAALRNIVFRAPTKHPSQNLEINSSHPIYHIQLLQNPNCLCNLPLEIDSFLLFAGAKKSQRTPFISPLCKKEPRVRV